MRYCYGKSLAQRCPCQQSITLTFNEIVGFDTGYNTRSKNYSSNIQRVNKSNETLNDIIKEEGIKYEKKVMDELKQLVVSLNPPLEIDYLKGNWILRIF